MLDSIIGFSLSAMAFIVALGILVLVHEWGHYIVAKLSGVWVEKFSIGFGPKILGFNRNGTDYRVAPIPLGGYVKLYGQDPWEEAEGDQTKALAIAADPRSFHSKSMPRKIATVMAGPSMNLVLCFFVMPLVFMLGRLQPKILDEKPVVLGVAADSPAEDAGFRKGDAILAFSGVATPTWQELLTQITLHPDQQVDVELERDGQRMRLGAEVRQDRKKAQAGGGYFGIEPYEYIANDPVVETVNPSSPADKAGIQAGDRVTSIAGDPIETWTAMTASVQKSGGRELPVTVFRNGSKTALVVTPELNPDSKTWMIGITRKINADDFVKKRHGPLDAVILGTRENFKLFALTLDVLGRLLTGDLSYKSLGGPIQIAKATSSAAKSGLGEFLYLLAFLSMQLGILNLLPVPVLDGGHVLLMTIETIRRKPLSPRVRQVSTQIGLGMLLLLMLTVTVNDIDTLVGFANIWQSIRGWF